MRPWVMRWLMRSLFFMSGTKITFALLLPICFRVQRQRICMADLVLSWSAACRISFADSTSAWAEMILLSASLRSLAALLSESWRSLLSRISLMNISSICHQIIATSTPHSTTYCSICFSMSSAISCLFSSRSCRMNCPQVFLRMAQVTSAMAVPKFCTRQQAQRALITRQQTDASMFMDTLSLVMMFWVREEYLSGQVHHVDLHADHAECFGAGVDIVQSRLDRAHVSAKLLVDSLVALGNSFVGVVDATTEDAWRPRPEKAAALAPVVQTRAITRQFLINLVLLRQSDVLGFTRQSLVFIGHLSQSQVQLHYQRTPIHQTKPKEISSILLDLIAQALQERTTRLW